MTEQDRRAMENRVQRTDHEAARLAEIREVDSRVSASYGDLRLALAQALRLLEARPHDAEFVTRAKYDEMIDVHRDDLIACNSRMEAAERRVAALAKNYNDCEERAGRLAAALATSEAKLCEAQVVINAALADLEAGDEAGAHLILKHAAVRPAEEK